MKNILVIAYYFPPSGGPGVQRSLKFVRYLPDYGWMPTVLTVNPEDAAFPAVDESLLKEIPPMVEVARTSAFNPFEIYARLTGRTEQLVTVGTLHAAKNTKERLIQWLRANLFIPDARIGWNRSAIKKAFHLLKERNFDAILTTSPPHSTHLIGRRLHQKTGVPWVADFRDPWTGISYYHTLPHTKLARWWDAKLEQSILNEATLVTMVSPYYRKQMQQKMHAPEKVRLLSNGFDLNDFPPFSSSNTPKKGFTLGYIGSLFVNPAGLWEALSDVRSTMPHFKVSITGRIDERVWADICTKKVDDLVEITPYVPHDEALKRMQEADALLLVIEENKGTEGIMTGKLFEYLATQKPILAIGPPQGDAAKVLQEAGHGRMISKDDVSDIGARLLDLYQNRNVPSDLPYPNNFTRQALTQTLANWLDEITASNKPVYAK
ncbi:MAG: glycosyltransferase [Rhodothermia bacterium]|nr:glycosyltransferase [Rhodothermia bacterium]